MNNAEWEVVGAARKKPHWWPPESTFLEIDFLQDGPARLNSIIKSCYFVIHLCDLTKTDSARNLEVAAELFKQSRDNGVERFIYASSIRVYSGLCGIVDEDTPVKPASNDIYGQSKIRVERALTDMAKKNDMPITILRLGNVFSQQTVDKIPRHQAWLTKIIYRGMNHHLISADNVAFAISSLCKSELLEKIEIINITHEIPGENDYFFLEKKISCLSAAQPERLSTFGKWFRFYYCKFKNELPGEYFLTVLEKRLMQLKINYPASLPESLAKANAAMKATTA